mmetsp:Transcript_5880/g.9518  ORF Transcript_5880/g.9518 Transcript_5880/m.9518 type:complete len:151 (+) Transcript_5880:1448-1900(+)
MVKFQPFINALTIALLSKEGPSRLVSPRFSTIIPLAGIQKVLQPGLGNQLNVNLVRAPPTYASTWKYKLPMQFRSGDLDLFLFEHYNQETAETFLQNKKFERCIHPRLRSKVEDVDNVIALRKKKMEPSYASISESSSIKMGSLVPGQPI